MADTIRVLYVDDEPGLLDIGKLFLEKTGEYTVDTLESAIEALLQLKTKRYDAIISDYQMPDMDGIEFLKQLKASENTTPFIIFTGRGREDVVIQALNEGADFYLQKGGEPKSQFAELSNKIRYAVTRKSAEEALIRKNEELYASYEQITATEEELRTNLDKLTRQEMALRESEERYRSVVNDQTEMIARFTPDGNLTFVNEAYRSYFASLLDIKDVKGHNIRDILQVKNYAEVEKFLSSLSQKTPIREIERVVRGKDGDRHWQIWSVRALFAADGSPAEYQVVGRDITDSILQKNTEKELRRSEQRSLAVSMNAGSWIWEVDPNGVYRYTSPAVEQILGYRPDELVGKMHCYDLFDPSMLEEQKATVLAIFNRHEPCRHLVMHGCHRNGTPVVLNTSAIPVFEEDGTFSGYYGINEDITERKRAEEAQKMSEIHLAEAMDLAHLGGWEFNVRTGLFTFDDRFYALYGTTVEREGGSQISAEVYVREFVHPEDRDIVVKFVEKANKKTDLHCVSQLEHRIIRRDGEIRHIVVRIDVTKDAEGRIIKTHGVNQDITERKRAEEALRESRQILETIINTIPVRVFWKDKNLTYLGCNTQFARDAGFEKPEEIIGKDDYAMGWGKQAELYRADDRLVIESGRPRLLIEEPQTTPSGEEISLLTSKVPLKNVTGEVIGVLGTYFDITERKRAEQALRESEEILQDIIEKNPMSIQIVDRDGFTLKVNHAHTLLFGSIPPSDFSIFADLQKKQPELEKLILLVKSGEIVNLPDIYFNAHDSYPEYPDVPVWVRAIIFPLKDKYGKPERFVLMHENITERKRAEQAIHEAARYTRRLIEVSLDSLVTISPGGRITDVNAATEQVTGYSRDHLIGTDFSEYFTDFKKAKEGYQKVFDQGVVLDYPLEIRHKDGKITSVLYNATVYRDGSGKVQGVFAAARDITERKRVEDALKMANQKLSILSSITRHDINNQLAVLTGYLRILEKKQPDPTLNVYSQKVASAAKRISTMILFTKEYEQLGVEGPVWQDIGKIAKMAAVDLLPENVDLNVNTGSYEIFADPMFMLVLYNLFENAIRHGVKVTEITIHFNEEESSGMLIVEDNGIGIPAPIKERIFERGFGTNTGFGLYLIRQILPITGLSIRETGIEGKGARFEISLPPGTWRKGPG
jgi:PAS domain S-box-containing protein